ncbi:hypothetical protein [Wenxinia saemankumensis]|uniref:Uncharacterized protein n=1 Tax=Wenxinia saemankumensis TaxID=1447782 RepID=A0A1M6EYZ4_9RHOB|nr:hypothetical protein [Wenxinia saemankumensis]SHI90694.1 hypothetical protein SAMN05444417_2259 [Wenxinia saemankumensis]
MSVPRWSKEQKATLTRMHRRGATAPQIAVKVGRSVRAVENRLTKLRAEGKAGRSGRIWTEEERARGLALLRDRVTHPEIARRLGRTERSIAAFAGQCRADGSLSYTPPNRGRQDEALFERLWSCGTISIAEIAAHFGITHQAVSQRARTRGLPSRIRNRSNRTIKDDAAFTRLWLEGVPKIEIAERFGVRLTAVSVRVAALDLPLRVGCWRERFRELQEEAVGARMRELAARENARLRELAERRDDATEEAA